MDIGLGVFYLQLKHLASLPRPKYVDTTALTYWQEEASGIAQMTTPLYIPSGNGLYKLDRTKYPDAMNYTPLTQVDFFIVPIKTLATASPPVTDVTTVVAASVPDPKTGTCQEKQVFSYPCIKFLVTPGGRVVYRDTTYDGGSIRYVFVASGSYVLFEYFEGNDFSKAQLAAFVDDLQPISGAQVIERYKFKL